MKAHELPTQLWAVEYASGQERHVLRYPYYTLAEAEAQMRLMEDAGFEGLRILQARIEWR